MTSVSEALKLGEEILTANGIAEARRDASLLLRLAIDRDKAFIYAHPEFILSSDKLQLFESYLQRRADREPAQYIAGVQEFYGLEFEVTPDVLIPRPETEMVVERAISILGKTAQPYFCDVGTGSGCIPISVLVNIPSATAVALDISPAALEIARRNSERHGCGERLTLHESDLFSALTDERFDLITCNPPYVPLVDMRGLQAEVRDFEPRMALTDQSDGLSIIRRLIIDTSRYLQPGGFLLIEIGFDQAETVSEMFDKNIWTAPELFPDLQGIPRLVLCQLN